MPSFACGIVQTEMLVDGVHFHLLLGGKCSFFFCMLVEKKLSFYYFLFLFCLVLVFMEREIEGIESFLLLAAFA